MEEILSSIRRIIADEETDDKSGGDDELGTEADPKLWALTPTRSPKPPRTKVMPTRTSWS